MFSLLLAGLLGGATADHEKFDHIPACDPQELQPIMMQYITDTKELMACGAKLMTPGTDEYLDSTECRCLLYFPRDLIEEKNCKIGPDPLLTMRDQCYRWKMLPQCRFDAKKTDDKYPDNLLRNLEKYSPKEDKAMCVNKLKTMNKKTVIDLKKLDDETCRCLVHMPARVALGAGDCRFGKKGEDNENSGISSMWMTCKKMRQEKAKPCDGNKLLAKAAQYIPMKDQEMCGAKIMIAMKGGGLDTLDQEECKCLNYIPYKELNEEMCLMGEDTLSSLLDMCHEFYGCVPVARGKRCDCVDRTDECLRNKSCIEEEKCYGMKKGVVLKKGKKCEKLRDRVACEGRKDCRIEGDKCKKMAKVKKTRCQKLGKTECGKNAQCIVKMRGGKFFKCMTRKD